MMLLTSKKILFEKIPPKEQINENNTLNNDNFINLEFQTFKTTSFN